MQEIIGEASTKMAVTVESLTLELDQAIAMAQRTTSLGRHRRHQAKAKLARPDVDAARPSTPTRTTTPDDRGGGDVRDAALHQEVQLIQAGKGAGH